MILENYFVRESNGLHLFTGVGLRLSLCKAWMMTIGLSDQRVFTYQDLTDTTAPDRCRACFSHAAKLSAGDPVETGGES